MGIYDGFKFKPAKWLPSKHLSLEDLERLRNLVNEIQSNPPSDL